MACGPHAVVQGCLHFLPLSVRHFSGSMALGVCRESIRRSAFDGPHGLMADHSERLLEADLSALTFAADAAGAPPARARAVVVGGGIIGASVAFHLAELGWKDTVLLERGQVSCGTTWHAAGLMTRTRGTHVQTELAGYSRDFYKELAERSGVDIGYYENGSLTLAQTDERMIELGFGLTMAHHHGFPAERLRSHSDR